MRSKYYAPLLTASLALTGCTTRDSSVEKIQDAVRIPADTVLAPQAEIQIMDDLVRATDEELEQLRRQYRSDSEESIQGFLRAIRAGEDQQVLAASEGSCVIWPSYQGVTLVRNPVITQGEFRFVPFTSMAEGGAPIPLNGVGMYRGFDEEMIHVLNSTKLRLSDFAKVVIVNGIGTDGNLSWYTTEDGGQVSITEIIPDKDPISAATNDRLRNCGLAVIDLTTDLPKTNVS